MITIPELDKLKAFCKKNAELSDILTRIDAICPCCMTCGRRDNLICTQHNSEIPDGYHGPCDDWDFKDVTF